MHSAKYSPYDLVFHAILVIASLLALWPLPIKIHSHITAMGDPVFVTWVIKSILNKISNLNFDNFSDLGFFFPYENTLFFSDHSITLAIQTIPIFLFTDSEYIIQGYNQILSLYLSSLAAYLLARELDLSRSASLIAGLIIGVSPYHIGTIDHIQVSSFQYTIFTMLFATKWLKQKRHHNLLLASLSFLATSYVSIYQLAISAFILPAFLTAVYFQYTKSIKLRHILYVVFIAAITAQILYLSYYPYKELKADHQIHRSLKEVDNLSAKKSHLLLTPTDHWLFGQNLKTQIELAPDLFWSEFTLYMGLVPIIIMLIGILVYLKSSRSWPSRIYFLIALSLCIFISVWFAFGINITPFGIRLPSLWLTLSKLSEVFAIIRAPTRAFIVVIICIGLLTAISYNFISAKLKNMKQLIFFNASIFSLLAIDLAAFPRSLYPMPLVNNKICHLINSDQKELIIMHLPFYREIDYLRIQDCAPHKMINGYSGFFPNSTRRMMDLTSRQEFFNDPSELIDVAARLGTNQLIAHKNFLIERFGKQQQEALLLNLKTLPQLTKKFEDSDHVIFDIKNGIKTALIKLQDLKVTCSIDQINITNPTPKLWVAFPTYLKLNETDCHVNKRLFVD